MFIDSKTGKLKINGEVGTPAWCARTNTESFQRIASSLEEIAQCLKNNNQ